MKALAAVGAGVLVAGVARARLRNWGATRKEIDATYPGDDLVAGPVSTTTYAVSVAAPAETVWNWLGQIGQDRGGMYSYDWLENLFGLDIHNADQIREEWQQLSLGDAVRVVPRERLGMQDGYAFRVALVDPPHALVLASTAPGAPLGRDVGVPRRPGIGAALPAALTQSHGKGVGSRGGRGPGRRRADGAGDPADDPEDAVGHQGARRARETTHADRRADAELGAAFRPGRAGERTSTQDVRRDPSRRFLRLTGGRCSPTTRDAARARLRQALVATRLRSSGWAPADSRREAAAVK